MLAAGGTMTSIADSQLIHILQVSVAPIALVSGIGLLILSMTNRLGRVIDRGRALARELRETDDRPRVEAQLVILARRAVLLKRAITAAASSVLSAAVLIIVLFLSAAFSLPGAYVIGALFVVAMGSLILSMTSFLMELGQALHAYRLDVGDWENRSAR